MKKIVLNLIVVIAYVYCLGDILIDFPNNPYLIRAVTGIMSTIFLVAYCISY